MGDNGGEDKPTTHESSSSKSFLASLSSWGLTLIGVLYLIGYIIVNGYQTKTLHYSSSALQFKHIAAGVLYVFMTLYEVLVISWCIVKGRTGWRENPDAYRASTALSLAALDRPTFRFLRASGEQLYIAMVIIGILLTIVGIGEVEGVSLWMKVRPFVWWTLINIIVAIFVSGTLYEYYGRQFDRVFADLSESRNAGSTSLAQTPASPETAAPDPSGKKEEAGDLRTSLQLLRLKFIGRRTDNMGGVLGLTLCVLFSLVSFQSVYGHLNPDYGGGALFRVRLAVAENKLSNDLAADLLFRDSWLLLVDRDDKFIHLLRVDKSGAKRLFQIEASAITALEILPDKPIHPDDAAYALQHSGGP